MVWYSREYRDDTSMIHVMLKFMLISIESVLVGFETSQVLTKCFVV